MGFRHGMIVALGFMLTLPPVWTSGAEAPATRPAHTVDHNNALSEELVPELNIDGLPMRDFVEYLADQWKDVQIVQFTGPWQDLVVPRLHLRNVTRRQVMELLGNMFPDLDIHSLDQDLYHDKFSGNVWIFQQVQNAAAPAPTRVSAFGLAQTVDRLAFHRMATSAPGGKAPDKDLEQKTLKDVLSLIEATLEQSAEPGITPTVMLHEPTETVLVKGTEAQINAVQQAIQALNNSVSDKTLEGKLLEATNENSVLRQQLAHQHEAPKAASQDKPGSKE